MQSQYPPTAKMRRRANPQVEASREAAIAKMRAALDKNCDHLTDAQKADLAERNVAMMIAKGILVIGSVA